MSDKAGLRRILADLNDNNAGLGLAARQPGDIVQGYEAPVLVAEDNAGLLRHLCVRDELEAASGACAQPVLAGKNPSGQLVFLNLDADGSLVITDEAAGTVRSASSGVTVATIGAEQEVVKLTLTADKEYRLPQWMISSTQEVLWRLVWNDDGSPTELARLLTDVGDVAEEPAIKLASFTAGSSGTQELIVYGTQNRGPKTDLHAVVSAVEGA
jgi:hypothetical protein